MADDTVHSSSQDRPPALQPDNSTNFQSAERRGFLPFPANAWDRIFISGLCLVAIHLLWLRFIEAYIPLWGAMLVSVALGVYIFKRG